MVWNRIIRRLKKRSTNSASNHRGSRRRLRLESLAKRELLASDLGAIGGTVFTDVTNNGVFDVGTDTVQAGVQVQVFEDTNNNNQFDSGTDVSVGTQSTAADGTYRFDGLSPGTHFIVQAAIAGQTSPGPQTVEVVNDGGVRTALIDDYSQSAVTLLADSTNPNQFTSNAAPEAAGGSRDISLTLTSGGNIIYQTTTSPSLQTLSSGANGIGNVVVQYDGTEPTAALDATGLNGLSLAGGTPGGDTDLAAGIIAMVRADNNAGEDLVVEIFSGAGNSSSATIPLPLNAALQEVFIPFSSFTTTSGAGADFDNVGAIEASIEITQANNDVFVSILDAIAPVVVNQNLANTQLLSLGGTLFEDDGPGTNQNNGVLDGGETGFNNITVQLFRRDATDGSLDPATDTVFATTTTNANGDYNFPNLEPDDYLVVVPDSQFANGANLFGFANSTGNDPAPDPDNDLDDDDNGTVVAGVGVATGIVTLVSDNEPINDADNDPNTNTTLDFGFFPEVDLTIAKTLDAAASTLISDGNGQAVFTIRVENLGPAAATNVVVTDVIPAGLVFDATTTNFAGFTNNVNGQNVTVTIGNLAAGANRSFVLGTTINANQFNTITNTTTVTADEVETNLANNTDTADVALTEADLVIEKVDATDPVNAGDQEVYTINVTNNGPDAATNVMITDTLPADVTFVSGNNPNGGISVDSGNSSLLNIAIGDLANGQTKSVTITVDVSETASSPLNNIASVVADPNNDSNMTNNNTNEETVVVRTVDVTVDKQVSSTSAVAGENVTYTLVVSNNGPGEARNVTATDVLDSALTFVSFNPLTSGVTHSVAGQNLTFDVGTLASGANRTFSFDATVASSTVAATVIPNVTNVTTSDTDSNTANNQDNVNITVQNQVDLILTKTVDRVTAVAGQDQLVYTFQISHDTDSVSDARNVVLTDTLPAGVTGAVFGANTADAQNFNSATRTATVTFNTIPVGETRTFTITTDVDEDTTGTIVNPASITATVDDDASNNTDDATTTVSPQFDVTISKQVDDETPQPGQNVTYTIGLTNSGPSTATGVVLTDDIPAGLTFVSGSLNGSAATSNGTTISFPGITLADDATANATLVFTVSDTANGNITNTATVTADNGETNLNNNLATEVITVTPQADITVTKSVNLTEAQVGSTLVYTMVVSNNGPSVASNVIATDTLPAGVTFVSGTGPSGALAASNGQVIVNGGDLAVNGSFTFTINATVNSGITTAQTNQVVVATDTAETNANNNTASAVTTIDPVTSSIAGTVYIDTNNNGAQDAGEAGIAGVALALSGTDAQGNAVSAQATTDADGDYIFANLAAGSYTVTETQPAGFRDGRESPGSEQANTGDDVFTQIALGQNVAGTDFDFGELAESLSKRRFLASS